jgi:molybdopterin molybdotransferase
VAIKPGKPVLFGQAGRTPVVGLPGNPVSSMVTFELFVAPGLRRMMGDRAPYPPPLSIRLADAHRRKPGRLEFARATLSFRDGVWSARLHPKQGSGSLTSVVGVDALVILPSDQERFEKGESLLALPFPSRRGSAVTAWTDNPYS